MLDTSSVARFPVCSLKDLNQTITAEAAMQIVLMLAGIIQRNVTDRDQRTKINSELNDIVVKQIV